MLHKSVGPDVNRVTLDGVVQQAMAMVQRMGFSSLNGGRGQKHVTVDLFDIFGDFPEGWKFPSSS